MAMYEHLTTTFRKWARENATMEYYNVPLVVQLKTFIYMYYNNEKAQVFKLNFSTMILCKLTLSAPNLEMPFGTTFTFNILKPFRNQTI